MENNIDLKALWNKQPVPAADNDMILKRLAKLSAQKRRSYLIVNSCLLITSVFIGWIWFYFQPQFVTTKIGIVLMIGAMLMYVFVFNKLIPLYKTLDVTQFNRTYLAKLVHIRKREQFLQTTITNLYFIVLSTGLGLYMYEYASRMDVGWSIAAYGFTTAWIMFNWFYFRPRQIRKNREKIDLVIQQVQALLNQLKEHDTVVDA